MRLLLVEDDDLISEALYSTLTDSGYKVQLVKDGMEANLLLTVEPYDAVILDLTLPKLDGLEILVRLRQRGNPVPVLILSARDSLPDRVKGLNLGANDYLVKPFELVELEARLRSLLRKAHFNNLEKLSCGMLNLEIDGRLSGKDGQDLQLSERETIVLSVLLRRSGKVVHKAQLVDALMSKDINMTYNALDIVVHRLRKKIASSDCSIHTSRGVGYALKES
jgi:DNA-binding response OmpR family regulator